MRSNDSDSLELPFQLENLLLDGYLRKTNKFVAQLLTPSFNSLICRSGMPGLNLSSNIPLATSLKILDISAHDLEIIYLPLFPSIKTLSVRVFVEEDELIHLSSIFESFPVGSITRLKLNLDLVLIEEVDIVEADPILSRLIDIMNCPSLALLESLEIIHDGWIREDKGKEMSTEWEKRGISTVISILMDDEDCEEE